MEDQSGAPLSALGLKMMTDSFIKFVKRTTPLVNLVDTIYQLFTIQDTKQTIAFLMVATYAIIYQETIIKLLPLAPLGVILLIFYNFFYQVKFTRPKINYMRNMKLIQAIMGLTGDMIDQQFSFMENFIFWKNKEKTLVTLNVCFFLVAAMIPLWIIPIRYFVVVGLWGAVA